MKRKKKLKRSSKKPRQSKSGRKLPAIRPTRSQRTKKQTIRAVQRMRRKGSSLRKASREIGVSPRTVIKHAGSALKKSKGGRYAAEPSDRLQRPLLIPTPGGSRPILVRGSRDASQLGRYWDSLHRYYETGDRSRLEEFTGKFITDTSGAKFPLLTNPSVLDRLGSAGVLSFESLYAWSE